MADYGCMPTTEFAGYEGLRTSMRRVPRKQLRCLDVSWEVVHRVC